MRRSENKKSKGKSKKDIAYYIIMAILLCVICFSGFKVYQIASEYKKGTDTYNDIASEAGAVSEDLSIAHLDTRLELDWVNLISKNADAKAWIRCVGTVINYPIVQGSDNDYYLNHMFDGTWNVKGTIFIDSSCAEPFDGFLTIMYGHRINEGSMFACLLEYLEKRDKTFFEEHPVMELYTPAKDYDLQIFGAAIIDSRDSFLYGNGISEEADRQRYIDWVADHNALIGYDNSVTVTTDDRIVMMSTCLAGPDNDNRVVVWGKLVEVDRDLSGN